jgi:hypothetical protein
LASFYALAGALFVGWLMSGPRPLPKWLWLGGACLVLAPPMAVSRALAYHFGLTGLAALIAVGASPRALKQALPAALVLAVVVFGVAQTPLFQTATEAFSLRWEHAVQSEGHGEGAIAATANRVIHYGIITGFNKFFEIPLFGEGIGIGTNVGAQLLTGERAFLVGEGAWPATLGELGPIFGLFLILYRVALTVTLGVWALIFSRQGNHLPLIVGSVAFYMICLGGTATPTDLGFLVITGGLMLAAFEEPEERPLAA